MPTAAWSNNTFVQYYQICWFSWHDVYCKNTENLQQHLEKCDLHTWKCILLKSRITAMCNSYRNMHLKLGECEEKCFEISWESRLQNITPQHGDMSRTCYWGVILPVKTRIVAPDNVIACPDQGSSAIALH